MSLQSNKQSQTKSSSARRKDIYKKSKYYQEKRQKLLIATGIGIFVLVFILILAGIRGCSNYMSSRQAAAKKTVSMNASKDNSQKASSDSQNTDSSNATVSSPVSLTLSVVGDCTLGTDETFDYDTSLNAYYENYGADYFLQNVKDIFSADDLTIANFEGTLTDSDEREDKTFAFKAPASYASILTGGSVEAVNTANNHSHDYGDQSFDDTLAALDDAGIVDTDGDGIRELDGQNINLRYISYENRLLNDFADAHAQYLAEIGIGVVPEYGSSDDQWSKLAALDYDFNNNNWITVGTGDPLAYMANWATDTSYCAYSNPDYDKLYEELKGEMDPEKRKDLIFQMQQILVDDAAVLIDGYYNSSMIYSKKVGSAHIHTADYYWLSTEITPAE